MHRKILINNRFLNNDSALYLTLLIELHCRNMEVQINSEELRKLQEEKKRSLEEVRLEE